MNKPTANELAEIIEVRYPKSLAVEWDVVACDEHDGKGAFTDARNALGQAAKVCYSLRSVEGFGHGDGCWSYEPCVQMYS